MPQLSDLSLNNSRVLLRVDFNVPLNQGGQVVNDKRIQACLPTIHHLIKQGASLVIMSHLGRPNGQVVKSLSLKPIAAHLANLLGRKVKFSTSCVGDAAEAEVQQLQPGDVLLLENLRFHKEETAGDRGFAKQLAKLGDCYVNDAFGTAHRAHASTSVIAAEFPGQAAFGLLMEKEITQVDHVIKHAKSPSFAIIGGAKVSSKIDILDRLIDQIDGILIGGGMSFTFIKALGGKVGNSLVEDDYVATAQRILDRAESKGVRIHLPADVVVGDAFDNEASRQICPSDKIPDGWMGLDIGPQAITDFSQAIQGAETLLWNGPMGVFEMPNFSQGTRLVGEAIATATTSRGAYSLVGGGDSVAAAAKFNLADRVSYVSTGGGAMLEYLEGKTLPGIQAVWDAMDTNDHTH